VPDVDQETSATGANAEGQEAKLSRRPTPACRAFVAIARGRRAR
jgi:hypothetical protein